MNLFMIGIEIKLFVRYDWLAAVPYTEKNIAVIITHGRAFGALS